MARLHAAIAAAVVAATAGLAASPPPAAAQTFVSLRIGFAPPPLPVYVQPAIPGPDYIWTPGYWAWSPDDGDYYWVPGVWVRAPRPGLLWTPGWWGWSDGYYVFHSGYWGPHVGFYGGVVYGFGYDGFGFQGGYWNRGAFFYNRSVTNITNVNVTNVYNKTVVVNRTTVNNVSYNGGPGGAVARATAEQRAFSQEAHVAPTPQQQQHVEAAHATPAFFARANHGQPRIGAVARPAVFNGAGMTAAHAPTPYRPPA